MGVLSLGLMLGMTCKKRNQPPGAPSIPSGPSSGRKGDWLRFSTVAEDPDGDSVAVRFDWGDSTMSDWSELVASGESVAMTHGWDSAGTFSIRAQAKDTKETASAWSDEHQLAVTLRADRAPGPPTIPSGPTSGRKGDSLRFSTVAEDPDGDSVAVRFDWGDSTGSGWSDWVASGESVAMTHAWQRLGAYSIRAQAKDSKGAISGWSGEYQLAIASFSATFGGTGIDRGYSVRQTNDGGYIITGITGPYGGVHEGICLIKTDSAGNQVWFDSLGGIDYDCGRSVQQTSDGGYIVAGSTYSSGSGGIDVHLVKTDPSGHQVWSRTFGGSGSDFGYSVEQTFDGGYVIAGYTDSYGAGEEDVCLIKTDVSGNQLWFETFGGSGGDFGYSVEQTFDGGYVIAGYTGSFGAGGSDIYLIKTDSSGNQVWFNTFGGSSYDYSNSVQQTADGGYVITGTTGSHGDVFGDACLVKADSSGNQTWFKTFGGSSADHGESVQQTFDGGYTIAGTTNSYGAGGGDVYLVRTNFSGDQIWFRTFGGSHDDVGNSVQQTSDGGFIIAGSTESYGAGSSDAWLIKTDAEGN
jgi:hypothetical protein